MKKKIVLILISFALLIGLIFTFIFIKHNTSTKSSYQATLTTELTPEIIERLHSYPYYEKEPNVDFKQVIEQRQELAEEVIHDIFNEFNLFDKNQKFITNEKLVYISWNDSYVVRGILQTVQKNGKITEQDVEYQYYYGGWDGPKNTFEEMRVLSDKRNIKGE